jgi:hypothetical protein
MDVALATCMIAAMLRWSMLLVVMLLPSLLRAEPDLVQFDHDDGGVRWKTAATKSGVTLERRSVSGSSFYEYRAVVGVPLPPARVAEEVWRTMREGDMDSLKHRDILRASVDELIIYDQIRTPIVSDRDYTVRVRRMNDAASGRTQFRCESANELGPPPKRGYVRIPIIRAGWMTAPDGKGGTLLTYYAFSEPGGTIPAFLVHGAQQDRSLADVIRILERLRRVAR